MGPKLAEASVHRPVAAGGHSLARGAKDGRTVPAATKEGVRGGTMGSPTGRAREESKHAANRHVPTVEGLTGGLTPPRVSARGEQRRVVDHVVQSTVPGRPLVATQLVACAPDAARFDGPYLLRPTARPRDPARPHSRGLIVGNVYDREPPDALLGLGVGTVGDD